MVKSGMKWMVLAVLLLVALLGCEYDDDDENPGNAPVIHSVELYKSTDTNQLETNFSIGESMVYWIYATDPEGDIAEIWSTHYHPNDSDTIYYGPNLDLAPEDAGTTLDYTSQTTFAIQAPKGSYRVEFQLVDKKGNKSKIFPVYYHIN